MSLRVHYEILNQKGTPAFFSDTYANRPTYGFAGRVFISTDTGQIFEDTGSAWSLIADAGVGGGTLASVTANGNTTATGIVITAGGLSTDSLTDTALTTGSVLFSGTGGLVSQKNANLFWDNTNNRLGINTTSPGVPLDIHSTGTNAQFNGTGTSNAYLQFQNAGTSKWRIGNTYNAGANTFDIYNNGTATNALSINNTTNAITGVSFYGTATDGNYFLKNEDVEFRNMNISDSIRLVGTATPSQAYLYFGSTGTNYFGNNGTNFLLNGGNLLVGTTTDSGFKCSVSGGIYSLGGSAILLVQARDLSYQYGFFADNGTNLNFFNSGSGNTGQFARTTGIYTPTSDINKKKDFELSSIGLNAILGLKPTLYRMKSEENTEKHLGFIAQEVKEFIPQAYVENDDFIGLNFNPIVATLVKAIQELNEKLERNNIN